MRDELQDKKSSHDECMVINTDHSSNGGTHWTCLFVKKGVATYFDSFGFPPPVEVIKYCKTKNINSNSFRIQQDHEVICGHYCIYMLYKLSNGYDYYDVLDELYRKK